MSEENKDEAEMLTHTVAIDQYMHLEWKIPKVITPIELKAMTQRVNKLFNLSEVQISEDTGSPAKGSGGHWTPQLKDKLRELYKQKNKAKAIAKVLHGMTNDPYFSRPNVVHQQINYLKKIGQLKLVKENVSDDGEKGVPQEKKVAHNKGGVNKRFTQDDVKMMTEIWSSGKNTAVLVRDAMTEKTAKAFSKKQIADKLYQMKLKGMIK